MSDVWKKSLTRFQRRWVQACAVYPVLRWPLTVHLGRELAKLEGREAPDLDEHVALARLPWFRDGFIPDEARRELISDMDNAHREAARSIFEGHLLSVPDEKRPARKEVISDDVFTRFMMREEPLDRERAVDTAIAQNYGSAALLWLDGRALRMTLFALATGLVLGGAAYAVTRGWTEQSETEIKIPIPQMVELPAGAFDMGSPLEEAGRWEDEWPIRPVIIARFQIARTEVTRAQYAAFVRKSGYKPDPGCWIFDAGSSEATFDETANWAAPGFAQSATHPAVCISWNDAQAYITWLNALIKGGGFRLPTEAEWEYAARAGNQGPTFWTGIAGEEGTPDQCGYANGMDQTARADGKFPEDWEFASCDDGYVETAPVGSFLANGFSLQDMSGNVWEWVEDCWHDSYEGAPKDGSAWVSGRDGDCGQRVLRGGSWDLYPRSLRSAYRNGVGPVNRSYHVGFRLARTLTP